MARVILAAIAGGAWCVAASAQEGEPGGAPAAPREGAPPAARPVLNPLDITGRDFAGLRLPPEVVAGRVAFAASVVTTWEEPPFYASGGQPSKPVQRMLLQKDVSVTLGTFRFTADNAVVWMAPLEDSDPQAAPDVVQVYVYFQNAGTPEDDASVAVRGDRLSVEGVMRIEGGMSGVLLHADVTRRGRPDEPLVREGERALAERLRRLIGATPPAEEPPGVRAAREDYEASAERILELEERLLPAPADEPIFAKSGVFTLYAPGTPTITAGEDETTIQATDGVVVQYWDRARDRTLQLTAQRAVVFLDGGHLAEYTRFDAANVRGIYLEGDVMADDGRFSVRAPRVYYDVRANRAVMLDAVYWTYDRKRRLPLYVRAETIRQESTNTFKAEHAKFSNTAFFEPHLSVGASTVTITQQIKPMPDGTMDRRSFVDARNITMNAGDIPFFYWPVYAGDPEELPLREIGLENSGSGTAVKTAWNALSLLGLGRDPRYNADLLLDYYFDRGLGLGTAMEWRDRDFAGDLVVYGLPNDTGEDVLSTGAKIQQDGELRGMVLGEHRAAVTERWTLSLELAYISDDTFVDAFYPELGRNRREFENSIAGRRLEGNSYLSAEVKGTFNDFISNQYLVQTPGYSVQRTPDATYARLADDLLGDLSPGLLTWSSEYRAGYYAMAFAEPAVKDFGFNTLALSERAFGVTPDQSIADRLRAEGLNENGVGRFDTRQELSAQLRAWDVNFTPFAVGRFTAYSTDFESFSPEADEPYRLWGDVGMRADTMFQRVDNSVESRTFDLHRIRHLVEPSVTFWTAATTINRGDLPVYDQTVEDIQEGTATRLAVDQTWQSQRGGPARSRSVDVFKLNAEAVISSSNVDASSPVGRFFDFRPEYSTLGTFGALEAVWQASEAVGLAARTTYDFDLNQPAYTYAGAIVDHTPDFSSFAQLRYVNSQNNTFLTLGTRYVLTTKYSVSGSVTWDTEAGELQYITGEIRRRFPNVVFGVSAGYNNINDVTSFGFVFQPVGFDRSGAFLRGLGGQSQSSGFGG